VVRCNLGNSDVPRAASRCNSRMDAGFSTVETVTPGPADADRGLVGKPSPEGLDSLSAIGWVSLMLVSTGWPRIHPV
jgi:hypothetical protein